MLSMLKLMLIYDTGGFVSMPTVKTIEDEIFDKEGFNVVITMNTRNVRSDKKIPASWPYQQQSENSMTVKDFKDKFTGVFSGYSVNVLDGKNNIAAGNALLSTVRDSYNDGNDND